MKLIEEATDVLSRDKILDARVLTTDRANSFFPSCHNDRAYICKPFESSRPRTLR